MLLLLKSLVDAFLCSMKAYRRRMIIDVKLYGGQPLQGRTWDQCFTYEPKWH